MIVDTNSDWVYMVSDLQGKISFLCHAARIKKYVDRDRNLNSDEEESWLYLMEVNLCGSPIGLS